MYGCCPCHPRFRIGCLTLRPLAFLCIGKLSCVVAFCRSPLPRSCRVITRHDTLDLPIGRTAFSDKALFYKFQWMAQHTHPLDGFFNDSARTLYLSLQNPTPAEFVTYDETTRPEQMAAVVEALKRNPPAYIALIGDQPRICSWRRSFGALPSICLRQLQPGQSLCPEAVPIPTRTLATFNSFVNGAVRMLKQQRQVRAARYGLSAGTKSSLGCPSLLCN